MTVDYSLFYELKETKGAGFSFPCDELGNIFVHRLSETGKESLEACILDRTDFCYPRIEAVENHFIKPAVGQCSCGNHVELRDALDNECEKCGAWYNMSGQQVTPSYDCDEYGSPLIDFSDF